MLGLPVTVRTPPTGRHDAWTATVSVLIWRRRQREIAIDEVDARCRARADHRGQVPYPEATDVDEAGLGEQQGKSARSSAPAPRGRPRASTR